MVPRMEGVVDVLNLRSYLKGISLELYRYNPWNNVVRVQFGCRWVGLWVGMGGGLAGIILI